MSTDPRAETQASVALIEKILPYQPRDGSIIVVAYECRRIMVGEGWRMITAADSKVLVELAQRPYPVDLVSVGHGYFASFANDLRINRIIERHRIQLTDEDVRSRFGHLPHRAEWVQQQRAEVEREALAQGMVTTTTMQFLEKVAKWGG